MTPIPDDEENSESEEKFVTFAKVNAVEEGGKPVDGTTYTFYFAPPADWGEEVEFRGKRGGGNQDNDTEIIRPMSRVPGYTASNKRPIYVVSLRYQEGNNGAECTHGGYVYIKFISKSGEHTIQMNGPNNWLSIDAMGDHIFDADGLSDTTDTTWNPNCLKLYADVAQKIPYTGQKISFQNKTENELTNITVTFYKKDSNGYTADGKPQTIESLAAGEVFKDITIPDGSYRYVRFTDASGSHIGKPYYNFYNDDVASEEVGTFQYNAETNYCFIYKGPSDVQWGVPNTTRIYFDATFSDMSYQNDSETTDGMPGNDGKLYYILTGAGQEPSTGEMTRLEDRSESRHLWYVNVPEGYTSVQFSDTETPPTPTDKINGRATNTLTWDSSLEEPCFYADTGDDITYGGGYRDGYWGKKSDIRDAEAGKKKVDQNREPVVNLEKKEFTQQANTKYISTTLYDYYSDYELNGNNRANYNYGKYNDQRSYVTFEQFDRALSDYYSEYATEKNTPIKYPLYTGHFQPSNMDNRFATIANNLGLYGWGWYDHETDEESRKSYWRFIAANNSNYNATYDANKREGDYTQRVHSAFQGLVNTNLTSDGSPTIAETTLIEPHFNEAFLTGKNKAKAVLGKVYKDVAFPFKQAPVFADQNNASDPENAAQYWYFDSNETSLYLKQDGEDYYLEGSGTDPHSSNRNSSNTETGHGFFPFNQNITTGGANQYNYGFGAKLQFDFTLTDDGHVVVGKDEKVPIKFFFSGDDDVWVFIDNKLVLDVGGAHGRVDGLLEFSAAGDKNTVTAYVSDAKAGQTNGFGITYEKMEKPKTVTFNKANKNDNTATRTFNYQSDKYQNKEPMTLTKNTKHTLTMYYMERGMWESNMAVAFNFPDHNELQVEKQVDANDVRGLLKPYVTDPTRQKFTVGIKNWATHYAPLDTTATTANESDNTTALVADSANTGGSTGGSSGIGFTTKQYTIKDYGSVNEGKLMDADGAQYTTSKDEKTYEVKDGKFTLQNGETVTFADQFRRGSYISLQEDLQDDADQNLYAPTWEIHENGKLVMQSNGGTTVEVPGDAQIMQRNGTTPDDGRKEKYKEGEEDGRKIQNTGYTVTQKPKENSIVFRSYSNPDGTDQFTKLKVKFINKVRTGSLSITKQVPDDERTTLGDKTYTFTVEYSNIGGLGGNEVVTETVPVKVDETVPLKGIPIGTKVTIKEETPENQYIKSITVNEKSVGGNEAHGTIVADTPGTDGNTVPGVRVVFTNTARKPIAIAVEKTWKNAEGGELTDGLPTSIWIKLQRRHKGSTSDTDWENVQGTAVELKKDNDTGTWTHTFPGMDAYDISGPTYYEYRVVESDAKTGDYKASGTLTLGDYNYQVYSETRIITNNDDSASLTLTNKQVPPVYELAITKQGLDENGNKTKLLNGVEFKLEKLSGNSVDTTFKAVTKTTKGDGDNAGKCSFTNLSEGSYRLTELKTVDGYNLLAAPIEFTLQNGKCLINGETQNIVEGTPAKGYTVNLIINNRKGFTLPHTGADAPSLWLLIGLPLLVAGLLVLVFRYNRKGGKRS